MLVQMPCDLEKANESQCSWGKSSAVESRGAFHLSRNSGWDANRTHVFLAFHWKIPGNKWNFEKVALSSRRKLSGGNACSIDEFSQGITSSRLFTAIFCATILNFGDESINKWNLCQMEHVLHSMDLSMDVSERFWYMENPAPPPPPIF